MRLVKIKIFSSACIFVLISSMTSVFAASQAIPLKQLIKIAVDNNSQLKSKRLTWQGLIHKYKQAISLNDPTLIYSEAINPIETRIGPQDRVLVLNQKIPYRGKLALKGEVIKKDIEMAKVSFDKASRDLIVALKKSYYELVYLENAVRLSKQNQQLLEKVTHLATNDYAANISALNDVAKAQSQTAQVSYDVLLLEELRATQKTQINTLLNRDPEFAFEVSHYTIVPPKFNHVIAKLYQWAESNEEVTLSDIAIQKSLVQQKLANYANLPDFTLGARYTQIGQRDVNGLDNNGRDGFALNLGINIPLNRSKNKAITEQARLQHLAKIEDKKTMQNGLKNSVRQLFFKLNNAYRQTVLYQKNLIPQANRALQIAQLQYRENKGSIGQYLEAQSTGLNFQLAYQRALADYWQSHVEMEKLTGKKL